MGTVGNLRQSGGGSRDGEAIWRKKVRAQRQPGRVLRLSESAPRRGPAVAEAGARLPAHAQCARMCAVGVAGLTVSTNSELPNTA